MKRLWGMIVIFTLALCSLCGCSHSGKKGVEMAEENYTTEGGEEGWIYLPDAAEENPEEKRPLVMVTCAFGENPEEKLESAGWIQQAQEAGLLLLVPKYKTTESYSQTKRIKEILDYAIAHYPVDTNRIYAAGFSNGGGAVGAMTNDYPGIFAGICFMSWMMPLKHLSSPYEVPFQIIQGSEDLTLEMDSGAMRVIDDEVWGIESLMRFNDLLESGEAKDFDKTEYWGYEPDEVETATIEGTTWTFSNYYKDGYSVPLGQLVLIEGGKHELTEQKAFVAWDFLQHYARGENGALIQLD